MRRPRASGPSSSSATSLAVSTSRRPPLPPPPPYTPAKRIGSSRGGTHPNFGTARQRSPRVTNRAYWWGKGQSGARKASDQTLAAVKGGQAARLLVVLADALLAASQSHKPARRERRARVSAGVAHRGVQAAAACSTIRSSSLRLARRAGEKTTAQKACSRQYTQQERQRGCGHGAPISRPNASARHAQKMAMLPSTRARSARTRASSK